MNTYKTFSNRMLESSSGRQTQTVSNSLAPEDKILEFKPQSSHPGPIVINRKKTLRSLMKENLKEINSITFIDFTEISDLTKEDLDPFFVWICRLDNLRELSMNLSQKTLFWNLRAFLKNSKSSLKKINPIRNITSLKINLSSCKEIPDDFFQHFVRKFPHLWRLDINLTSCDQLKEDLMLNLSKSIRCLSCLRVLSLNFSNTRLGSTELLALMSSLKRLTLLRSLKLDFSGSQELDASGIEGLCKALGNLEHLQGLSLELCHSTQIDNNDIRNLVCCIKELKNLSKFLLSLVSVGPLDLETLQILTGHEGGFHQLTHFTLKLPLRSSCPEVPQDSARSFVPLANLSVLELSLCDSYRGSQWIKEDIWEGLTTLPKLSRLCLHFVSVSKMIKRMLKSLGGVMKRLKLKEFDLNFPDQDLKIKTSTWKILFDGVGSLDGLKKLALNGFSSIAVQELGRNLKQIKGLVDFSLGIRNSFSITQINLQSIGVFLRNQKNLTTLKFNFIGDDQVKPKDLREVFPASNEAKSLTKISLKLGPKLLPHHGNQVSPISYLREILSLRYLELEASRCDESGLLALSVQLAQLSQVVSIILRFDQGRGISPQTKLKFSKNIRELKGLKQFHLSIQENRLLVAVGNFYRISWGMKDIYAGYDNSEVRHYKKELKRIKRLHRFELWFAFFFGVLLFSLFAGYIVCLVLARNSMEAEQRKFESSG